MPSRLYPASQDEEESFMSPSASQDQNFTSTPAAYTNDASSQRPPSVHDDESTDGGLLFSCRCESTRAVATLLSCLRNVSMASNASGVPSLSSMQSATQSLLPSSTDRRLTQGGNSANDHSSGTGGGTGKMQYASVFCSEKGLTFQVHGVGRQSRATVDLSAGMFTEYHVAEQTVIIDNEESQDVQNTNEATPSSNGERYEVIKGGEFGINLSTVLGCLLVLGPASLDRTTLCLSFDSSEAIFKIELLEDVGLIAGGGVIISNCAIPGMSVEDDFDDEVDGHESGLDYAFRSSPVVARARVQSEFLKGAITELTNVSGAASVTVGISTTGLELATFGHCTECHVVVPFRGNHPEVFISCETEESNDEIQARSYPMSNFLVGMRGLEIAHETCISMNANGMIAIQHQVLNKVGNGDPCYVDYIMGCLEDENDDYNDEEDHASQLPTRSQSQYSTGSGVHESRYNQTYSQSDEEIQIPRHENNRQSQSSSRRTLSSQRYPAESDSQESAKHDDRKEDSQGLSQDSNGPNLFAAVASFSSQKRDPKPIRNTRRKISNLPTREDEDDNDDNDDQSESSQEAEFEFEESLDVTATLETSRRRSLDDDGEEDSVSSPQLMYGDTSLE